MRSPELEAGAVVGAGRGGASVAVGTRPPGLPRGGAGAATWAVGAACRAGGTGTVGRVTGFTAGGGATADAAPVAGGAGIGAAAGTVNVRVQLRQRTVAPGGTGCANVSIARQYGQDNWIGAMHCSFNPHSRRWRRWDAGQASVYHARHHRRQQMARESGDRPRAVVATSRARR
jgi:hypothetical protein